jgi:hypothetical protein
MMHCALVHAGSVVVVTLVVLVVLVVLLTVELNRAGPAACVFMDISSFFLHGAYDASTHFRQ